MTDTLIAAGQAAVLTTQTPVSPCAGRPGLRHLKLKYEKPCGIDVPLAVHRGGTMSMLLDYVTTSVHAERTDLGGGDVALEFQKADGSWYHIQYGRVRP